MEIFGINIEYDKWIHFMISAMAVFWILAVKKYRSQGIVFCYLLAIGKELYDIKNGNPEFMDFVYTVALPTIIYIILKLKRNV